MDCGVLLVINISTQNGTMDYSLNISSNEASLIQACMAGESWAQKRIYEEHHNAMLNVCMRYSSSQEDALDILHDGFLKVFQNIHQYQSGTLIGAWIKRIMINTAIDFYRKEKRRFTSDLEDAKTVSVSSVNPIHNLAIEEVMKAIHQLSPMYRSVFNLFVIEGLSHKEISETLHITESTSRSNLVKARLKLKEILGQDEEE